MKGTRERGEGGKGGEKGEEGKGRNRQHYLSMGGVELHHTDIFVRCTGLLGASHGKK